MQAWAQMRLGQLWPSELLLTVAMHNDNMRKREKLASFSILHTFSVYVVTVSKQTGAAQDWTKG